MSDHLIRPHFPLVKLLDLAARLRKECLVGEQVLDPREAIAYEIEVILSQWMRGGDAWLEQQKKLEEMFQKGELRA